MDIMTLPEYAKGIEKTDFRRPLVNAFEQSSDIFSVLPFEGMNGAAYEWYEITQNPELGFRAINEPGTTGQGVISPHQEASYIIDHDLDVDRAITDRHGMERRATQEISLMTGAGALWTDTFLNGDNTTDPREFDGLYRRTTTANGRLMTNSTASGGAALSLYNLDLAIMNTHNPTHIIMPRVFQARAMQAARTPAVSGNIFQTWDAIGTQKLTYGGFPILWGHKRSRSTDILPFTEVGSGGGGAVTSSIFVVSIGAEGLRGLQIRPMSFKDFGLLEDGITYRTHFSWDMGLVIDHPFALTRLSSITNAAFVA